MDERLSKRRKLLGWAQDDMLWKVRRFCKRGFDGGEDVWSEVFEHQNELNETLEKLQRLKQRDVYITHFWKAIDQFLYGGDSHKSCNKHDGQVYKRDFAHCQDHFYCNGCFHDRTKAVMRIDRQASFMLHIRESWIKTTDDCAYYFQDRVDIYGLCLHCTDDIVNRIVGINSSILYLTRFMNPKELGSLVASYLYTPKTRCFSCIRLV